MEGAAGGVGSELSLDAAASSFRADVAHLDVLLQVLADKLSAVPGLEPLVTFRRSRLSRLIGDLPYINDLHSRKSPIEGIRVTVGTATFALFATASSITCTVEREGAAGGRQPAVVTPFSEWIKELMAAVDARNRVTRESLDALQDLIIYDRSH